MIGGQPTIRIHEAGGGAGGGHHAHHQPDLAGYDGGNHRRGSASPPHGRRSRSNDRPNMSNNSQPRRPSHVEVGNRGHSPHNNGGGNGHKKHQKPAASPVTSPPKQPHPAENAGTTNSMLSQLQPNLRMRRKSSPAIHELASLPFTLGGAVGVQPNLRGQPGTSGYGAGTSGSGGLYAPTAAQLATRRLSSPPSLDKDVQAFGFLPNQSGGHHGFSTTGKDEDGGGSGSSSGSLHKFHTTSTNHPVRENAFFWRSVGLAFCNKCCPASMKYGRNLSPPKNYQKTFHYPGY